MYNSHIQPLTVLDLPYIGHLQPKGWEDIHEKIILYCLQSFCIPIKVVANEHIVGIGNLVLYNSSAWLSHIIVDEAYRGQGVGLHIVEYLIRLADEKEVPSINLIATDLGEPVYRKVGFQSVGSYLFLRKIRDWPPMKISNQVTIGTKDHQQQIIQLDKEITGENRLELIQEHINASIVFEYDGAIEGYYLPFLGQGCIYAKTERAGLELMKLKYSSVDNAVIPEANSVGIDFLIENGFEIQDTTAIRMVLGEETAWQPRQIFSRVGGNYG